MYRSHALLSLAMGNRCLLRVPGVCCGDDSTVVACHSNLGRHGKGRGLKAHDCFTVWGCHTCHAWLDQGKSSAQEREDAFEVAHKRQVEEWAWIAANPCARPRYAEAARRALQALNELTGGGK